MGMHLSVYVGPYFVVPRSVQEDVDKWESLVRDGRGEAGVGEPDLILVPNGDVPPLKRRMRVSVHGNQDVARITDRDVTHEIIAFEKMAREFLEWCKKSGVPCTRTWGVVPCWS